MVPWHQKCTKRRVDALHALGFSRAAYQARTWGLALPACNEQQSSYRWAYPPHA